MASEDRAHLEIRGVGLRFGGITALDSVDLVVDGGSIVALVGPNGAGKTCLLNVVSGLYRPTRGSVWFEGRDLSRVPIHRRAALGIARTFQGAELFAHMDVVDNLLLGRHTYIKTGIFSELLWFGRARHQAGEHRRRVEEIIDFFELERYRKRPVATLPYGVQKLVGVARAMAMEPRMILLDEPAAGMNRQEKEDLARFMLRTKYELGVTLLWVEHDMELIGDVADHIAVLDYGLKISEGDWQHVASDPAVVKAYLGEPAKSDRQALSSDAAQMSPQQRCTGSRTVENRRAKHA